MATTHTTLTSLAQQAAAQIGFTARRWWRDAGNPAVLCVEVERRLVGAPPAVAELKIEIPSAQAAQASQQAQTPKGASPGRKRPTTRTKRTVTKRQPRSRADKA